MNRNIVVLSVYSFLTYSASYYAQCENSTTTRPVALIPLNIQAITENYFIITGLIEKFQRGVMPHYSKFFDVALVHEVRVMFRRLYGYAINETVAIEWEAVAVKYLQLYVIHAGVSKANAHYDYWLFDNNDNKTIQPFTLQSICLSRIKDSLRTYLNEELSYPVIFYAVLLHELSRLIRLPVIVSYTHTKPYLLLSLNNEYYYHRFIDDSPTLSATKSEQRATTVWPRAFRDPIPFSPAENFENEIILFRNAQWKLLNLWCFKPSSDVLTEYANSETIDYIKKSLRNLLSNDSRLTENQQNTLYRNVLFLYMRHFIQAEYDRLVCHPLFDAITGKSSAISEDIVSVQKQITSISQMCERSTCARLDCSMKCYAICSLYASIQRANPIVGYTLQNSAALYIVLTSLPTLST